MNLLADESVDRQIVERLRHDGHDVIYIAEAEPSISDGQVFDRANEKAALLLITADKDFGEMVFRDGRLVSNGVVLIRLAGITPDSKAGIVSDVLNEHTGALMGCFSVISPGKFRTRTKH